MTVRIASAKKYEFIQNEALSNELAAKFWLTQGKKDFAQTLHEKKPAKAIKFGEQNVKLNISNKSIPSGLPPPLLNPTASPLPPP